MAIISRKDAKLLEEMTVELDKTTKYESVHLGFYEAEGKNWVSMDLKSREPMESRHVDPDTVEVIDAYFFLKIMRALYPSCPSEKVEPWASMRKAKLSERVQHLATTHLDARKAGVRAVISLLRDEQGRYSLSMVTVFENHAARGMDAITPEEAKKLFHRLLEKNVTFEEAFPEEAEPQS